MLAALSCVAYRDAMFAWPKAIVLRFDALVRASTRDDPQWTADFLGWLRTVQRYPALVGAAAFVSERLAHGQHGMSRQVVNSVLRAPDDPGHLLAHWTSTYGPQVPKPVKRGVADAVVRLYTPSAFRHDTDGHHLDLPNFINTVMRWKGGIPTPRPFRFGDVIALTHPVARTPDQGDLFRLALGRGRVPTEEPPTSVADLVAGLKRFDRGECSSRRRWPSPTGCVARTPGCCRCGSCRSAGHCRPPGGCRRWRSRPAGTCARCRRSRGVR
ncbi:hypothetical protein GCM10029964_040310 [Kibdelosporangium lantanae]